MLTTAHTRPAPLPWLATLIALIVGVVPFLISLIVQHGVSAMSEGARAVAYTSVAGGLVLRGGVAFLVAQWHGERYGQLAFQRPAIVLSLFGLFLLCWQGLMMTIVSLMYRLTASGVPMQAMVAVSSLLYPLLHALGTWLAWLIATAIMRREALPWPSFNARWRAAGLAAWTLASVLAMLAPMAVTMVNTLGIDGYALALASYAGAAVLPIVLAFAGAWLGLPRYLARIHGWRLLGATMGALVSGGWLAYRGFDVLGSLPLDALLSVVVTVGASLLLCLGAYWVWTFALYTGLRRGAP
jgi:hypothetical protein